MVYTERQAKFVIIIIIIGADDVVWRRRYCDHFATMYVCGYGYMCMLARQNENS